MNILTFLDANPFYKYALLFLVILPLMRKTWIYLIKNFFEHKK